jgi:hypothetical protein
MKFVVAGTGRSGTGYASELFTRLGLPCGHEDVFGPWGPTSRFREDDWTGDASWLVAPYLDLLPPGTIVLHQVRHPLDVIASWAGTGFFRPSAARTARGMARWAWKQPRSPEQELRRLVRAATPNTFRHLREPHRCATHWVDWNLLIEEADRLDHLRYVRYRLEDLDAALVRALLAKVGSLTSPDPRDVLESLPRRVNSSAVPRGRWVRIQDLGGAVGRRVLDLATRYGYEV